MKGARGHVMKIFIHVFKRVYAKDRPFDECDKDTKVIGILYNV